MSYDFRSLTLLWQEVLTEVGTWCRTSTARDWNTVSRRFEAEGFSFLTISLANFGKDFEKSLDQGFVGDDQFAGFSRTGGLPRFLGGFLRLVFKPDGSAVLDMPSIDAIQAVRQLTLMFSKVEIPCSDARNRKAVDGYVQVEAELRERDRSGLPANAEGLKRVFTLLYAGILQQSTRRIDGVVPSSSRNYGALLGAFERDAPDSYPVPRHGSGATADRRFGNEKFSSPAWTRRLDVVMPSVDYLIPNWRYTDFLSEDSTGALLEPGEELPVKVTLVPKTLKTPRIIAEEPTCMMYAQQAIHSMLREEWDKDDLLPHFVTFHDQVPNQELAKEGSATGRLATLDLSEASDRVSNSLVRYLFSPFPSMAEVLDATRSRKASVPGDHGVIRLAKYASMGSALCFPIETMVFLAIIILSWEEHTARPLRRADLRRLIGSVRVYGDDIVVPVELVPLTIRNLEAFGFKVNANKSFWTGKFRESCGGDYYDGNDVNVIKVRQCFPSGRANVAEVVATVSLLSLIHI